MRALLLLAGPALTCALASGAQAASCLTPVAPDGAEPPCNPYQASSEWGTNHRSSYAQGSSPFPAPQPGDRVAWQDLSFRLEIPVILQFSAPYRDGRRVAWFSTVSAPEVKAVYKVDVATGRVIDRATLLDEGRGPVRVSTSGVYNLLTRDHHFVTVRGNEFAVYGDARPGDAGSPITLLGTYALPPRALCRADDRIIGLTLTYAGELAFATVQGMVGVLPRDPRAMRDDAVTTASINGARCAEPTAQLEEVANSISADEEGGIYVVSTDAQYRFDRRRDRLVQRWRAAYPTGGGSGGTTLTSGSGSTPDVVGTKPGADKFVVITDGQRLMHATYFWRERIPDDWRAIKPGYDRRIACSVPVRFGDPAATQSISEQSVLTRGYSAVVVNNALPLDDLFTFLPPDRRPLATLTSNLPGNQPKGMQRIDWDPVARRCRSVWANPDISIPNAVPTMSVASGLIYGIGVRRTVFGLEGIDFATGRSRLWVPTSPLPTENSFFAATTIGPGGDVWVGGLSGISVFRGPDRAPPPLACLDRQPPTSRIVSATATHVRVEAHDRACDAPASASAVNIAVSVARVQTHGCRHLRADGRLDRRARSCSARRYLPTSAGRRTLALPRGRYRVLARARDRHGNVEHPGRIRGLSVGLCAARSLSPPSSGASRSQRRVPHVPTSS